MKNIKEIISYIIWLFGLMLFAGLSFFGFLYILKENDIYAFAITLLSTLILGAIIWFLSKAKKKEKNEGFTKEEGVGLLVYCIIAAAGFIAMVHFINLEYVLKDKIVSEGEEKVNQLQTMIVQYESLVNNTKTTLKQEADNHITNYRQNKSYPLRSHLEKYGVINFSAPQSAVNIALDNRAEAALRVSDSIKQSDSLNLGYSRQVFTDWKRAQLRKTFDDLDNEATKRLQRLQTAFKGPPEYERWNQESFEFSLSAQGGSIISSPFELIGKYKPGWLIPFLIAIIIHFFILMPYLWQKREGRFYPKNKKGGDNIGV